MREYIEATFADQPELRGLNLQIFEQEMACVRRVHIPADGDQGFHGNVIIDSSTS